MDPLWHELTNGFPDRNRFIIVLLRVFAAVLLGAVVGIERERAGKPAGLRTHMLVSLGTAVVVIACQDAAMSLDGLSRVIQGIVTGIGFIGAGTILKLNEQREIQGLTTAAGLWMTAAIGVAVGLGILGVAVIGTLVTVLILVLEHFIDSRRNTQNKN
ncbi:MAG TPA: MgtC/SapB family protein [Pyrinomonadaceae bacterium]|jgi:putative Mg2+ transporter-C (MgtC) family protein|nr:MgtC/SapB family protein [Pyrinomonadaceae bacterium]